MAVAVRSVRVKPMRDRRRKRVEARVFDESGPMVAVWFNQPWLARQLGDGATLLLHGKLRRRNEFRVTEYEPFGDVAPMHTVGLVPVYPATEGITAAKLRELMWEAYPRMLAAVEPLPARLRTEERLPDRPAALAAAHFPDRRRTSRRASAARVRGALPAPARRGRPAPGTARGPPRADARCARRGGRPLARVAPVRAHRRPGRAMGEIDDDLATDRPMQRLLMGEVGTGKTVVALHAMLRAVENGARPR